MLILLVLFAIVVRSLVASLRRRRGAARLQYWRRSMECSRLCLVCLLASLLGAMQAHGKADGVDTAAGERREAIALAERTRKKAEKMRISREYDAALDLYRQVLTLDPANPKAHWGAGRIFLENAQPAEALPFLRRAVDFARQSRGEGSSRLEGGKYTKRRVREPARVGSGRMEGQMWSEAISETALGIMLLDLGVCLGETAHFGEQIEAFEESFQLRPQDQTFANLVRVRQFMCAWKDWDASMKVIAGMIAGPNLSSTFAPTGNEQRVPPQHALYYPMPPELTLASARLCAEITCAAAQHKLKTPVFRHVQPAAAPLRVGVMSSQFGANSLGWTLQFFFSELRQPTLRGRTGVYALALTNSDGSKVRADIEGSAEHFLDLSGSSVEQVAARINAEGIHLLIDVDGYRDIDVVTGVADVALVLALRPTPLAVNWLGACASLGAAAVPFLISDKLSSPPEHRAHFTEALVLVPGTFSVSSLPRQYPNASEHACNAAGLRSRERGALFGTALRSSSGAATVVFGDFNKVFKLSPDVFDVWMQLLKAVDGSTLVLGEAHKTARRNLRREARRRAVNASRLVFAPTDLAHGVHLTQRLPCVHVALDPLHVSGHTTAKDALYAGVPVVSLPAERMVGRVAASAALAAGGGGVGVARDLGDYFAIAQALAVKPRHRAAVRGRLRVTEGSGGLFDTAAVVSRLQSAWLLMWQMYVMREWDGDPQDAWPHLVLAG